MSEFDAPSPTVAQRATAIKKAMAEIQRLRAKRQVADALNTRNGANTDGIHDLELNSLVLVWREGNTGQNGSWEGPYRLVSIDGENCVLALPRGDTTFRTTVIKPYLTPPTTEASPATEVDANTTRTSVDNTTGARDMANENTIVVQVPEPEPIQPVKRGRGHPRKHPITVFLRGRTVPIGGLTTSRRRRTSRKGGV
jgi:hypothetical protein